MAGVNNINKDDDCFELYLKGYSIPEISSTTGIALSTLRFRFLKAGILRTRAEGVQNAAKKGKLSHLKGRKREFTEDWCNNISKGRKEALKNKAVGIDLAKDYPRITIGKHKGKFIHRLIMEQRLGRELLPDECVHHIDGNKMNNSIDNLALITHSGHARLHRYQDELSGNKRERLNNGRFK